MTPGNPRSVGWFKTIVLPIVILALAAGGFALMYKSRPQAPAKPVKERVWSVQTQPAQLENRTPRITLYGRIESPRDSQLSAALTAFVAQVHVDEGHLVTPGQTLITLDDRDAQLIATQREAQANGIRAQIAAENTRHQADLRALQIEQDLLELAQRSVERFQALKGRKVGSDTQLEDAQRSYQQQALALSNRRQAVDDHKNRLAQLQAQLQQAEAQLASARLDLERARVSAPFGGRVARLTTAPGNRVREGDRLITLYNTSSLEVRSQLPSRYLPRVRQALAQGQTLQATTVIDDQPIALRLDRLSGEVAGGKAGVDALLRIDNPPAGLEMGRALELTLQLPEEPQVLSLPPQALYGLNRIYRIQDGRLQAINVERVGELDNQGHRKILVRSPQIEPGDQIVTTQLPNAITGLKVKALDSDADSGEHIAASPQAVAGAKP